MRLKRIHVYPALLLFAMVLVSGLANAETLRYTVSAGSPTVIKFTSQATLETFQGGTDQLSGWFSFDPDNLQAGIDGELVAEMASFHTGNPVRDSHMRDNHFEVKNYPTSVFRPKKFKTGAPPRLSGGLTTSFPIVGDFTIHGVTKEVEAQVTAKLQPDRSSIEVKTSFDIPLKDFSIPRPEFLFMRVGEVQKVETKFIAKIN